MLRFLANENFPGDAVIVEEALKSRDDWAGYFSVVEMSRIRMKPIFRVE